MRVPLVQHAHEQRVLRPAVDYRVEREEEEAQPVGPAALHHLEVAAHRRAVGVEGVGDDVHRGDERDGDEEEQHEDLVQVEAHPHHDEDEGAERRREVDDAEEAHVQREHRERAQREVGGGRGVVGDVGEEEEVEAEHVHRVEEVGAVRRRRVGADPREQLVAQRAVGGDELLVLRDEAAHRPDEEDEGRRLAFVEGGEQREGDVRGEAEGELERGVAEDVVVEEGRGGDHGGRGGGGAEEEGEAGDDGAAGGGGAALGGGRGRGGGTGD
mmetsp:Transcript_21042/g.44728  ORF Transcript_21042/g.44728 Transcript_21042/m.44728 type:complete len:270 (-) Transcript_21042:1147-1956(-)